MEEEFSEFMAGFESYRIKRLKECKSRGYMQNELRLGQMFMLYISEKWPAQYAIMATDYTVDCFYRDDIMPMAIECLKNAWQFKEN